MLKFAHSKIMLAKKSFLNMQDFLKIFLALLITAWDS